MPLVLLVIFLLIGIGFYEHDKAVLTEQTFLTARNMCMYGKEENMYDDIKKFCLAAKGIDVRTEESLIKAAAVSEGTVRMLLFTKALSLRSKENYTKCYVPDMIRMINAGMGIKEK